MDIRRMKVAGNVLYCRSVNPLKHPKRRDCYLVGFDTEYTSKTAELVSIQLWHRDRSEFTPWPRGKKLTPSWLYAHAVKLVGRTDRDIFLVTYFSLAELQFLPVVAEGFKVREYARGSLDVTFAIPGTCNTLNVFDLCRWFDGKSLASAARAVGLRKLEYDTKIVTRACLRDPKFRHYALHDAYLCYEIIHRVRAKFIEETSIDPLVVKTPASSAASTFRHKYIEDKLFCDDNRARYVACRGTWGGRAEAFARGRLQGDFQEYDFTSAYPMAGIKLGEMPVQRSWKQHRRVSQIESARGGFCEIDFCYPRDCQYPGLPVFTKNAMIYPLRGRSWCTYEEVKQALADGADVKIVEAWGYHRGTTALRDFLQWTLDERADAKHAGRVMWKLLGNSIIGKFAQQLAKVPLDELFRVAEEEGYYVDELLELTTHEQVALGCHFRVSVGPIFMPEWNGLICGYTRAALAELVRTGEAVYCHTDSAWCRKRPQCSRLAFDVKTSGPAIVVRTRFAAIGRPLSLLGIKAGKVHVAHHSIWSTDTACKMLRVFNGEPTTTVYQKRRPLKLRESIKSGRTPGVWVEESRKGTTAWCGKRRLAPDGSTTPWSTAAEYLDNLKLLRKMETLRNKAWRLKGDGQCVQAKSSKTRKQQACRKQQARREKVRPKWRTKAVR